MTWCSNMQTLYFFFFFFSVALIVFWLQILKVEEVYFGINYVVIFLTLNVAKGLL